MGLPFRPVAFRGHCVQHDLAKTCLATALLPFEKTSVFRVIVGIAQLGQIADRLFFSRSECLQEEYEEVDCLSPTIRNACKKEEEGDCLSPSIIPHLSEEGDCLSPSIPHLSLHRPARSFSFQRKVESALLKLLPQLEPAAEVPDVRNAVET